MLYLPARPGPSFSQVLFSEIKHGLPERVMHELCITYKINLSIAPHDFPFRHWDLEIFTTDDMECS